MAAKNMSIMNGIDIQGANGGVSSVISGQGPPDPNSGDPVGSLYMDSVNGNAFIRTEDQKWIQMAGTGIADIKTEMLIRLLVFNSMYRHGKRKPNARAIAESYVQKDHDDEDRIVLEEFLGVGDLFEDLY
jgi:hypothetical protein